MTQNTQFKPAPKPSVIWFTGFSGAGKSTLANRLAQQLSEAGYLHKLLDGDELRRTLCKDLGYSLAEREENIRRIGAVAKLFCDSGFIAIVAAISPLRAGRDQIRGNLGAGEFVEVFVETPLAVCEARDTKGLYRRARGGDIKEFTGIDSIYEPPLNPEIRLSTDRETVSQCASRVSAYLKATGRI